LRRLAPDFKTIADFRKHNGLAIRKVGRELGVLCRRLDLFAEAIGTISRSRNRHSPLRFTNRSR